MIFLYSKWLELPINVRHRIASELGISKKGSTHVQDNQVVSDGYLIKEVEEALHIERLQKILHTDETDMAILWDILTNSTPVPELPKVTSPVTGTITKKKNAKTKNKTK